MQLAQYIRMSTVLQQDSPDTQKSIIKEYCDRQGHVVARTYEDSALSAGSMEKRDALIEMIMDAEKHLFEGVIIYKYDRVFRNLGEQIVTLKKLQKYGIKIIAVADPNSDGASGELITNILGAVNQFERQLTGERIYDKNRKLAKEGRWTGSGIDPTGYRYDHETKELVIIEDEAETVKTIFDLYLEYKSITRVVDILHEMDIKTKTGLNWNNVSVHAILTNPLYAGKRRWGFYKPGRKGKNRNCEVFDGNHEAIVSLETFQKVQEVLRGNRLHTSGRNGRIYLLGGLMRCSLCGGVVASQYKTHLGKDVYYCKERYTQHKDFCQGWHRVAYRIENAVYAALIKNIKTELTDWDRSTPESSKLDKNKQTKKKLAMIESKLLRQIEMYEEGIIDKETFNIRRLKTLREKEQLEKDLQQKNTSLVDNKTLELIHDFERFWNEADTSERKEILKLFIHIIHTDGHSARIEFINIGLPWWETEAEVPVN